MAVSDRYVVDAMTLERDKRNLVLRIFDHFAWDDDIVDTHFTVLQNKLNDYLNYIEGQQMDEVYSSDLYDRIIIRIVMKYKVDDINEKKLFYAKKIIEDAGYYMDWEYNPIK